MRPYSKQCEESLQRNQIEGPVERLLVILMRQCSSQRESKEVPICNARRHPLNAWRHTSAENQRPSNIRQSPDKFEQDANKDPRKGPSLQQPVSKYLRRAADHCSSN